MVFFVPSCRGWRGIFSVFSWCRTQVMTIMSRMGGVRDETAFVTGGKTNNVKEGSDVVPFTYLPLFDSTGNRENSRTPCPVGLCVFLLGVRSDDKEGGGGWFKCDARGGRW